MDDAELETRWSAAADRLERAVEAFNGGDLDAAADLAGGARDELAALLGAHPDHANAITLLGRISAARGDAGAAATRFRAALEMYDGCVTDEEDEAVVRPFRAEALADLAEALLRSGDQVSPGPLFRRALAEATLAYGAGAIELARFENALGVHLRFTGNFEEAEAAYLRAAALRDAHGFPHPSEHFHNLSGLASARGDYVVAERHSRDALAISLADPGDGVTPGTDWCGLGDALAGQERLAEAEEAYRRGLACFAGSSRPDHPEVAYALHNLGDCLTSLGRGKEAEAAYRASIARKREAFGDTHPEIAATLSNLAALQADLGRLAEARSTSAKAVAMARAVLPPGAPIRVGVESLARSLGVVVPKRKR